MGINHNSPFMKLLKEKSKTPEEVADAVGVKDRTVYYWLSGHRIPRLTIEQTQKLCTLLDCTIFELPTDFSRPPQERNKEP